VSDVLGVALVIGGIALAALAGAVALSWFIARGTAGGARRGALLCAAFMVAVLVTVALAAYVSVYYVKPVGWVVAVAASAAVAIALFVSLGRRVRWGAPRVLALVGLGLLSTVLLGMLAMALTGLVDPPLPYTTRARQIAQANGFAVLMPRGEELQTDSLPVDSLPPPDAGVSLAYEDFMLEERKVGSGAATGPLEERLRAAITEKATEVTMTETTVRGAPAVAAEYLIAPPEGAKGGAFAPRFQRETKLIFELGDVEVRLRSFSTERESEGDFVPVPGLTTTELAAVAEALRPPPP
jgi:hypothetical protein